MPKLLSPEAIEQFQRDGYYFPARVMSREEAFSYRRQLEDYERRNGGPLKSNYRHKVHLLFPWACELVKHPRILDAVEDLLGPDLICWTTNLFIKEPHNPHFVSMHQDSTYWGLDPADVATAWIALSDVPLESGPMKFAAGTHREQLPHKDTFHEHNLLSRGQEIEVDIPMDECTDVVLQAGEISLHHVRLAHGSGPNDSDDRRIGLAIRYVPPYVRQVKLRDSAMLVRGKDDYGHFDWEQEPADDADAAAIESHKAAMDRQVAVYYEGTDRTEMRE
ncbi:MAG: phytanoyl-CoA dioxygenase family protein [Gammaproteobacteria bacterium]|nr:phytanoyl-CoA dioxygenase family protein [Gammaproteobacteria bacterium]